MSSGSGKPGRSVPAGLVLAVTLIQLAHLVYFDPFVGTYGDTAGYVGRADTILTWPAFVIFYQPLYLVFLKISMLLSDPEHFRRLVVLAQIGMVVAAILLLYHIVLRLTERRWLAAAAALLVALDVRITIYEYIVLTEILAIFLSVCFLYAIFRALVDSSRLWAGLGALSLLALALTKFTYVALTFLAAAVFVLLAWRLRRTAFSTSLRRCAVGVSLVAVLLAGKIIACYHYTGAVSSHSGAVLQAFLCLNPEIVLGLPGDDPDLAKFKESYAEHGSLLFAADLFGGPGPAFSRATAKIYVRAVFSHPIGAMKAALKEYYWQTSQNYLFIYPEETNYKVFESSRNALFAIEKGINHAIFGSWQSVAWNSLCLLLGVLCLLTRMPAEHKVLLALLLGFIIYTIGVSTWMFGGFWTPDNSRMRLMYEAPLIALWFVVPYRLSTLRRPREWLSKGAQKRSRKAASAGAA